ncbi:MAG: hypothetical protein BWY11_00934 [Firmicutes bacterium ADurb.Bin182]|nr:MAG: hypothetical protein BWY11_00934 [Firmicutes bacterium ADurb.Bin182]
MRLPDKKKLILAACLFTATLLITWILRIPLDIKRGEVSAGAYINLGDIGVFAAAVLLGGPIGALTAALSSAFADLFVGSAVYALPTLIIKGGMALLAAKLIKRDYAWRNLAKAVCVSGAVMMLGYFFFDLVIMGNYEVAALSLPYNALQAIANGLISLPVLKIIGRLSCNEVEFNSSRVK